MSISLVAALLAKANAGPALALASEQSPPKFIDVTALAVDGASSDAGYRPRINTYVHGVTSDADAVRFEVKQKGKVLVSQRCPLGSLTKDRARVQCVFDGTPLTVTGDLTAQLIYIDDQAEQEYLLRDFKLKVQAFTFVGKTGYQILQDDTLGHAYFWQRQTGARFDDYALFGYFGTATDMTFGGKMRCTAAGVKLRDIDVSTDTGKVVVEALDNASGEDRRHKWTQMSLSFNAFMFGMRDEVIKFRDSGGDYKDTLFLGDNPGDWVCDLRKDGAVVRTFRFHVNDQGRIDPHPAQSVAGAPLLRPGVVMIDVRLPAKNAFDLRVRGSAIKGSMAYGMPWPKHDSLKEMLDAAPPDSGFPDPKPGKKKRK
ncbi:MAG: hypothetical protein IPL61_37070 [Myxococcales bacterium]|nr:hypothetical protein [Myxococcales bacterium]